MLLVFWRAISKPHRHLKTFISFYDDVASRNARARRGSVRLFYSMSPALIASKAINEAGILYPAEAATTFSISYNVNDGY